MSFSQPHNSGALPALRFEPDGFRVPVGRIMGRHSAGKSFMQAFVTAAGDAPVTGVGGQSKTAQAFLEDVRTINPQAHARFLRLDDQRAIAQCGAMHLADPSLNIHAYLRQSIGPSAYSLTGITHTISSMGAMGLIADLLVAPVMPWDGLICTSAAVEASVRRLMAAQKEYLTWRFKEIKQVQGPQLATIPLGIHCAEFSAYSDDLMDARASLGIRPDEIVFLFLGRLSFHAKAHPLPMYLALDEIARETGQKIVLLQCGWFANKFIENAFVDGASRFASSLRHIFLDGHQANERRRAWTACDVFLSLSDNIQETFGLTLVEAMAAGKPVIATDWDGYRQTVKHGETGFMVPTFMPETFGEDLALAHAAGVINYDQYLAQASSLVSVDLRALHEAIRHLIQSPELRRQMGAAGQARARALFDWPVIMAAYRDFWADLAQRRATAARDPAPRPSLHIDPGELFATYPTRRVNEHMSLRRRNMRHSIRNFAGHPLCSARLTAEDDLLQIFEKIGPEPRPLSDMQADPDQNMHKRIEAASLLAKWGLIEFEP